MNYIKFFSVLLLLSLISCNSQQEAIEKETVPVIHETEQVEEVIVEEKISSQELNDSSEFDYTTTELPYSFVESSTHFFSTTQEKDVFTFYVPQGSIMDGNCLFLIQNKKGDTLWRKEFKTQYLIATYALDEYNSTEDIIHAIKERIKHNLSNEAFIYADNESFTLFRTTPPEDFENYGTYVYTEKNNLPIYNFRLGNESHDFVGYSLFNKRGEIIMYCC